MLKKPQTDEHTVQDEDTDIRDKIEITMRRLQELKGRVMELKRRCEEFRNTESEHTVQEVVENTLRCDKCGRALDPMEQVAVKDSDGVERSHYHKECFQALFK